MNANFKTSELDILSRPGSPVRKFHPKIKERPTLFCFDKTEFEGLRPKTADPTIPKKLPSSRATRPRKRLPTFSPQTSTLSHLNSQKLARRRSRSLQSPAASTHKLREPFQNNAKTYEGVRQAVFKSRNCCHHMRESSDDEIFLPSETEEEFCRMEELVKYLGEDPASILNAMAPTKPETDKVQCSSVQTDDAVNDLPPEISAKIKNLEGLNQFCTTEIKTLREELSKARKVITDQAKRLEQLNPREGPPWVVPSDEDAFKSSVDYFSLRTVTEPSCIVKVKLYQPGIALPKGEILAERSNQNVGLVRSTSAPPQKSYVTIYQQRRLKQESNTTTKKASPSQCSNCAQKPPISPASRTRSLPGKCELIKPTQSQSSTISKEPKKGPEYLAIALASREGLLREIQHSIKKGKKILHFRFNMLLASESYIQDLHFLLTSHRRFVRWLNNYVTYSMSLIERFDCKFMKTNRFYLPAILEAGDTGPLKGIFIPVPDKHMPPQAFQNRQIKAAETQTDLIAKISSITQCDRRPKCFEFNQQFGAYPAEPQVDATTQTLVNPSTVHIRPPMVSAATSSPSIRNVALSQLFCPNEGSPNDFNSFDKILREDSTASMKASRVKVCAANFGDGSQLSLHREASCTSSLHSDTPSSGPFLDCSPKTSNYLTVNTSSLSSMTCQSQTSNNCKGDFYDPIPSGTELLNAPRRSHVSFDEPRGRPVEKIQSPLNLLNESHIEKAEEFYNHKGNAHFRAVDLKEFILPSKSLNTKPQEPYKRPSLRKFATAEEYAAFFDETVENFRRKKSDPNFKIPNLKTPVQVMLDILNDRHESILADTQDSITSSHSSSFFKPPERLTSSADDNNTRFYDPIETDHTDKIQLHSPSEKQNKNLNEYSGSVPKPSVPSSRLPVRLALPEDSTSTSPKDPTPGITEETVPALIIAENSASSSLKLNKVNKEKAKRSFIPIKTNHGKRMNNNGSGQHAPQQLKQIAIPRVQKLEPPAHRIGTETNSIGMKDFKKKSSSSIIAKTSSLSKFINHFTSKKDPKDPGKLGKLYQKGKDGKTFNK